MSMLVISWKNYETIFVNCWIHADRHTDIQTYFDIDKQTYLRQADRQSETHGYMDRLADRWIYEHKYRHINKWTEGKRDKLTDGQRNRLSNR